MSLHLELQGVTKDFATGLGNGRLRALRGVTLQVRPGEIFGLLGPNGSGKSTVLKLAAGLHEPTAGICRVLGDNPCAAGVRARLGYMPEAPLFYGYLSAVELLGLYAGLSGVAPALRRDRIAAVLRRVGLEAAATRKIRTYSKGMMQRVGLAQALLHDPEILLLDEPTAGVDPQGVADMLALIADLKARGKTVVFSTHLLAQVETLCDRFAILSEGRLRFCGSWSGFAEAGARLHPGHREISPEFRTELTACLAARGHVWEDVADTTQRFERYYLDCVAGRGAGEDGI